MEGEKETVATGATGAVVRVGYQVVVEVIFLFGVYNNATLEGLSSPKHGESGKQAGKAGRTCHLLDHA